MVCVWGGVLLIWMMMLDGVMYDGGGGERVLTVSLFAWLGREGGREEE